MGNLLNLLAAVALLIWGAHLVRSGILRVFGAGLRRFLSRSLRNRFSAAAAGMGITALVQSSTATVLLVSSFVGQGWVALPIALAVVLGADVGSSLIAVAFSVDLSWLSPLLLLAGIVLVLAQERSKAGRIGRILIGLGLMLLALGMIRTTAQILTQAPSLHGVLAALQDDKLLSCLVGALLCMLCYSSLAVVLLTATLAGSHVVSMDIALGLVLGANLGSGLLAVMSTARASGAARQVPLANLFFKLSGVLLALPLLSVWPVLLPQWHEPSRVVIFHLYFNLAVGAVFLGCVSAVAAVIERLMARSENPVHTLRPCHLDPSALATPSLAISCAVREAMHQADVVESMLQGLLTVIQTNDLQLAQKLREMDDEVDALYSSIKYYLTKISREALGEEESRRWTDIIGFTINMEQIGDIIERTLLDIEDKKIRPQRSFSEAGTEEIRALHARLIDNLRLGMGVFLNGNIGDAQRLLTEKVRFRELERRFASNHLDRLAEKTPQSMETSSLHIDLISEMRRINSLICSFAYPILDSAGALAPSRLRSLEHPS